MYQYKKIKRSELTKINFIFFSGNFVRHHVWRLNMESFPLNCRDTRSDKPQVKGYSKKDRLKSIVCLGNY